MLHLVCFSLRGTFLIAPKTPLNLNLPSPHAGDNTAVPNSFFKIIISPLVRKKCEMLAGSSCDAFHTQKDYDEIREPLRFATGLHLKNKTPQIWRIYGQTYVRIWNATTRFWLLNSILHHILPHYENLTYFPCHVRNPDEPMRYPVQYSTTFRYTLESDFRWSNCSHSGEFYMFLNMRYSRIFVLMGKTVSIEPATSLFIISHPACYAIVRK